MAAHRGNGGSWAVVTAIVRAWLVATLIAAPTFSSRPARAADADEPDPREEELRRRLQADSAAATERERQIIAAERQQVSAGPLQAAKDLYQKQDYAGAAAELEAVIAADPDNPDALLLAGLAHLRLDDPANAGTRWERFTAVSPDPKLAQEIGRYNTIVLHEANLRYAQEAVARERELIAAPTSPKSVAVAPFRNAGSAEYAPLGKALASMLIDNLAPLPGVVVLEREQVNALIEEANLAGTGLVEKGSAVRAGKLLRAGRVVAGSHEDRTASPTQLRVEAALVGVDAGTVVATTRTEAPAAEFYKLIPGVAEEFAGALGQPLENLPVEVRQQIGQTHTKSIQAELLYGQALDALDRKDVDAARDACKKLAAEDPGFSLAKRKCDRIPAAWLTLPAIVAAVEALILTAAVGAGISTTVLAVGAVGAAAAVGGASYAATKGGGGGGGGGPGPGGTGSNNPPSLQGVSDRAVPAGGTAAIDMQCFDPDGNILTIQNSGAGPGSSFNQSSGNPASGSYRQQTNLGQAGQSFNVTFVCTDNGVPPASDARSARVSVLDPNLPTPVVPPTPVGCQPLANSCVSGQSCCSGSCGLTNTVGSPVCCSPSACSGGSGNECCRSSGVTMDCVNGRCCLAPGSPCPNVGPDESCCNGQCGPFGCDTDVPLPTPTLAPTVTPTSLPPPTFPPTPTPFPTSTPVPTATPTPTSTPIPTPTCLAPSSGPCFADEDCCNFSGGGICCFIGGPCSLDPMDPCFPCGC